VTALARREQRAFYQRLVNANRPANDLAPDLPGNALALGNVTRRDLIVRPRAPGKLVGPENSPCGKVPCRHQYFRHAGQFAFFGMLAVTLFGEIPLDQTGCNTCNRKSRNDNTNNNDTRLSRL